MRLWWWRKVRTAAISESERDIFERFGESVIVAVLASGLNPRPKELQDLYNDPGRLKQAADWLTERRDSLERRENRVETAEWAILIFVVVGVVLDIVLVIQGLGWLH